VTVNVSVDSLVRSPRMVIVNVFDVCPALNVSVPEAAV
jgi:hypothetical protein